MYTSIVTLLGGLYLLFSGLSMKATGKNYIGSVLIFKFTPCVLGILLIVESLKMFGII